MQPIFECKLDISTHISKGYSFEYSRINPSLFYYGSGSDCMLEIAFPASLSELLHSALLQPISICKFRHFDLFLTFEYFPPQLYCNPPKICKYLSLCQFVFLVSRFGCMTPLLYFQPQCKPSSVSMQPISTVQIRGIIAIVRIRACQMLHFQPNCCPARLIALSRITTSFNCEQTYTSFLGAR